MKRDPWEALGVDRGASVAEIKAAYRRRARETHPDRNPGDPTSEARFKEVVAAWEALMDPATRQALERQARGELPEAFLDDLANAIERAQTWIEVAVLPEVVRGWRGDGAEAAARFLTGLAALEPPRTFEPPPWTAKRRAARIFRTVQVSIERRPGTDVSALARRPYGYEILVNPDPIWRAGIRNPEDVDAVVMRLLLARYAQVVALGVRGAQPSFDRDELALARARAHDDEVVRRRRAGWALWIAVFTVIAAMLYAGWASQF